MSIFDEVHHNEYGLQRLRSGYRHRRQQRRRLLALIGAGGAMMAIALWGSVRSIDEDIVEHPIRFKEAEPLTLRAPPIVLATGLDAPDQRAPALPIVDARPAAPEPTGSPAVVAGSSTPAAPEQAAFAAPAQDEGPAAPSSAGGSATTRQAAAAPVSRRKPAPPADGVRIQLASLGSESAARQLTTRLKQDQPRLLGGIGLAVRRADIADRVVYRVQGGPVADRADAKRLCDALQRRQLNCLVIE